MGPAFVSGILLLSSNHYLQQLNDCKNKGNTEETLAMNYLGIVMPSKETNRLRF